MTDRKPSAALVPRDANERKRQDRGRPAVCGSRCCADRRWRYRCLCAMDTKFVDKNAVCAFTQALAVNKRIRRGTGQLPAVVRGSWTDTSMRRSYLICVCSGTNLRRLAHLQPGFVCMGRQLCSVYGHSDASMAGQQLGSSTQKRRTISCLKKCYLVSELPDSLMTSLHFCNCWGQSR